MNKEILQQILNTKAMPFTYEEIEQLMDEELEKDPDEMDTELVDLCLAVLSGRAEENGGDSPKALTVKKINKSKYKKIILISAIIALLVAVIVPVSADVLNIDASQKIVQFFKTHFTVNFSDDESVDLLLMFEEHGLDNVSLPDVFYNQESYRVTDFKYVDAGLDDFKIIFTVESIKTKITGGVTLVFRDDQTDFLSEQFKVSSEYDNVKQLKINDIDVLVFSTADYSGITYNDNNIYYIINISNCSFNEALKIAGSIQKG